MRELTKADLKILERLFSDEVEGALGEGPYMPTQFHHKQLPRVEILEREGYVRRDEVRLGGRFPVVVKGWALTLQGHMTYCFSADKNAA